MGSTASVAFHQGSSMLRHRGCISVEGGADVCSSSTSFVVEDRFSTCMLSYAPQSNERYGFYIILEKAGKSISNSHGVVILCRSKGVGFIVIHDARAWQALASCKPHSASSSSIFSWIVFAVG